MAVDSAGAKTSQKKKNIRQLPSNIMSKILLDMHVSAFSPTKTLPSVHAGGTTYLMPHGPVGNSWEHHCSTLLSYGARLAEGHKVALCCESQSCTFCTLITRAAQL